MADDVKKYYWLKLHKDFFKRHDIRIVEDMDNGKDYILFYMKLLLESIDHDGQLRFSETIPYNEKMLATITNTNIDIVRSAINVFKMLKLMEIMDDQTIYMTQTNLMLGTETEWAVKKREYRERIQIDMVRTQKDNVRQEIELEKDKELEIDKEVKKSSRFAPPNLQEVIDYCNERKNKVDTNKWYNFYESKGWMVGRNKMKDWKAAVRTWEDKEEDKPQEPTYKKPKGIMEL